MMLCYPRMMYVEFPEDEKLETLMGCHVRAMEYFGGVTRTCLYDNRKTVVIGQDERWEVIWNEINRTGHKRKEKLKMATARHTNAPSI